MNLHAIQHKMAPWDAYSVHRNQLILRLRTARKDFTQCLVVFWPRDRQQDFQSIPMEIVVYDGLFEYHEIELTFPDAARYLKYYFVLVCNNSKKIYFSSFGPQNDVPTDGFFEHLYTNEGDLLSLPEWAKGVTYYQIFVDRFFRDETYPTTNVLASWGTQPDRNVFIGGNLGGICQKIDYIKSLGVGCLYLTPIFKADFNHKYATIDYFEVDPDFGDLSSLKRLVEACHKKNIRILLDGVFNHCGVDFPPFKDLLKNQENSQYKDWFYIKKFPVVISESNYECVGDYCWMPKLNTSNAKVRKYILDIMRYWIREANIDGWRLDVADEVDYRVWEYAHAEIKADYPHVLLLGETWGDAGKLLSGRQLDSAMNYLFRDSLLAFIARRSIDADSFAARLGSVLARYHNPSNSYLYNMLGSHDTPRFLTECEGDLALFKLGIVIQMTFPGSPAIYYGDEMGLIGENDPDCRRCMPWENPNKDLLALYQCLAELRRAYPVLQDGLFSVALTQKDVFAYKRQNKNEIIIVVLNRACFENSAEITVPTAGVYYNLLGNETFISNNHDSEPVISLALPAKAVMILTDKVKPTSGIAV